MLQFKIPTRGLKINLKPMSLHVPPALWFEANRILKSTLQNDTAMNAENVLRSTNAIPGGIKVNHYFTDTDAYFVKTNAPRGAIFFMRVAPTFTDDSDFDTENAKYKGLVYFSCGWTDPLGYFASPGA